MAIDIDLFIGVKNDLSPFTIDLKALTRGLVIIGQSGCGKSFLIGRLVEEIIRNTTDKTRILFIDPNSDFTYGTELKTKVEFDLCLNKYSTGFLTEEYKNFKKREKKYYENFKYKNDSVDQIFGRKQKFNLSWEWLFKEESRYFQIIKAFKFSIRYFWAISCLKYNMKLKSIDDLSKWYKTGSDILEIVEEGSSKDSLLQTEYVTLTKKLYIPKFVDVDCMLEALRNIEEAKDSKIWREHKDIPGIPEKLFTDNSRINFIEIETIKSKKYRLITLAYILRYIFEKHNELIEQIRNKQNDKPKETLRHTFLLIDEAHNFAPDNPSDPHEKMLGELIHTIAAEGRKYGLHLILATQRPNKIKQGLLGECDNAIIMKMNSRSDLEHLAKEMRILDVKLLEPCLHFQGQGNALAVGEMTKMAPYVQLFKSAPRRTKEGGVDIEDF